MRDKPSDRRPIIKSACSSVFVLLLTIQSPDAWAHRVNVFAWQEGRSVIAQGYWASNKKIYDALLRALDERGTVVFEGRTDHDGICMFTPPGPGIFEIVLDAGMGHRATTKILYTQETEPAENHQVQITSGSDRRTDTGQGNMTSNAENMEALLDRKLKPVLRELTAIREEENRVRFRDVAGGLGYIVGLAGLAMWASTRKKRK